MKSFTFHVSSEHNSFDHTTELSLKKELGNFLKKKKLHVFLKLHDKFDVRLRMIYNFGILKDFARLSTNDKWYNNNKKNTNLQLNWFSRKKSFFDRWSTFTMKIDGFWNLWEAVGVFYWMRKVVEIEWKLLLCV